MSTRRFRHWQALLVLVAAAAFGFWWSSDSGREAELATGRSHEPSHASPSTSGHGTHANADEAPEVIEVGLPVARADAGANVDRLMSPDFPREFATREPSYAGTNEVLRFHPRDPREWQGMKVDVTHSLHCTGVDRCPRGMACVGGTCEPCTQDGQCAPGELCAMDHCVPEANVKCRSRVGCGAEELCFLTPYGGVPDVN